MTYLRLVLSYLPTALPRTDEQLQAYIVQVQALAGYPEQNDSLEHCVANQVLHLSNLTSRISKQYFVRSIHKAVANQAAFNHLEVLRSKEKTAREEQQKLSEAQSQMVSKA